LSNAFVIALIVQRMSSVGVDNGRRPAHRMVVVVLTVLHFVDGDLINVRFGPLCGLTSDMPRGPRSAHEATIAAIREW
jgi:hypothetical protein